MGEAGCPAEPMAPAVFRRFAAVRRSSLAPRSMTRDRPSEGGRTFPLEQAAFRLRNAHAVGTLAAKRVSSM